MKKKKKKVVKKKKKKSKKKKRKQLNLMVKFLRAQVRKHALAAKVLACVVILVALISLFYLLSQF